MKIKFKKIQRLISNYRKDDIFNFCIAALDRNKDNIQFPIWYIFSLMKWTYLFGGKRTSPKRLTQNKFKKISNLILDFNQEHITQFIKEDINKGFQILHNQQFYLQRSIYKEIYATQISIFVTTGKKYDINQSFKEKTGLSIIDFLYISQIVWLYSNTDELNENEFKFDGYFYNDFWEILKKVKSEDKINSFLKLLTLNNKDAEKAISTFKYRMRDKNLQTMEKSFFIMFPFIIHKNQTRLIHKKLLPYVISYYIYDFLKSNDDKFTTELGYRLEKYVSLGLNELNFNYQTENDLKKRLKKGSKLVDFYIETENIFIEVKASEIQPYPSVNPKDNLIFNSLKTSIFKAYFQQLLEVSKQISPNKENWGIIITFKEYFWSRFSDLYEIGKSKYPNLTSIDHLPPENVFIIDIYTWNKIIQIVKDKKATLSQILKKVKKNNSNKLTSKQIFEMHLDDYNLTGFHLDYLENELNEMKIG
mgnify:CR=1 FL=1